nr:hypothetical protein [Liquorilactobacillus satsumensis]
MKNLVSSDDLDRAIINGGSKAKRDVVNFLKKKTSLHCPLRGSSLKI